MSLKLESSNVAAAAAFINDEYNSYKSYEEEFEEYLQLEMDVLNDDEFSAEESIVMDKYFSCSDAAANCTNDGDDGDDVEDDIDVHDETFVRQLAIISQKIAIFEQVNNIHQQHHAMANQISANFKPDEFVGGYLFSSIDNYTYTPDETTKMLYYQTSYKDLPSNFRINCSDKIAKFVINERQLNLIKTGIENLQVKLIFKIIIDRNQNLTTDSETINSKLVVYILY